MYAHCLQNVDPRDISGSLRGGDEQRLCLCDQGPVVQEPDLGEQATTTLQNVGSTRPTQRHMLQMWRRCIRC